MLAHCYYHTELNIAKLLSVMVDFYTTTLYYMISKPLTGHQPIEAIQTKKKQQYCQNYNSKRKGNMSQETCF